MSAVNFSLYDYVPVLATTEVERTAYQNLRDETRAGILPLFELTRHRGAIDFSANIELLRENIILDFIIDLDKRLAPHPYQSVNPANPAQEQQRVARETEENDAFNAHINALLSPDNGFQNWRSLVNNLDLAIPVLQYTNPNAQLNAIIRQASLLSEGGKAIAMRITQTQSEILCSIASQIVSLLPSSEQLLLIFDCGQGRRGISEKATWVQSSLQSILNSVDAQQAASLSAVCMSNSYVQPQHEGLKITDNCDREIWETACDAFPFMYGDYAASQRLNSLSSFLPRTYRATVVHSHDTRWVIHRHENSDDPDGWRIGAEVIVNSGSFEPIPSWTDLQIQSVATNGLNGMETPRPWHAARICGHIERQFQYMNHLEGEF